MPQYILRAIIRRAARPVWPLAVVGLAIGVVPAAHGHPTFKAGMEDEMLVLGRKANLIGEADSGSQGRVSASDLDYRPLSRVGELVEVIPGLVATQHSGSGKGNQFFLRGFNLDHGTDFAVFFDGAPVNLRTHGHGQGYIDINFVIPELVEMVAFRKGPYFTDVGDFTAAGTTAFSTYDRLPEAIASATIGDAGYRRGLVAGTLDLGAGALTLAGEAVFTDSPFVLDEELEKFNGFAKYARAGDHADWSVSLSAYDASWTATDQVPQRAIDDGLIPRLGFIDPDLGGRTTRVALSSQVAFGQTELAAYALYYDLALFSNFTYFLNDPIRGDEFEQRDERVMVGGSGHTRVPLTLAGRPSGLRLGGDIRYDDIFGLGLFQTEARQRFATIRDDDVSEFSAGVFAELDVAVSDRLRVTVGVRGDVFAYDVNANLARNSGDGSDGIVTPTAGLAWRVRDDLELYANYGHGFHSNDVRGAAIGVDPVTLEPVDPVGVLVRAEGAEIGARVGRPGLNASLVGFWLELDSELVFVGDAGTTEPNDGSRRFGVEFSGFWQPIEQLSFDVSAAYTNARFKGVPDGVGRIPQAVETVVGAGMTVRPLEGVTTTVRVRHFGKAPLIEDGSVFSEPTTIVNLGAYYDIGPVRLGLDVLNLLDADDADITYFFESQLPGETSPVEDIHLHPAEPRQVRGSVRVAF